MVTLQTNVSSYWPINDSRLSPYHHIFRYRRGICLKGSSKHTNACYDPLGGTSGHLLLALLYDKRRGKQMMTFIICVAIYLVIGIALLIYGIVNEPFIMAVPLLLPLIILLWPYFIIRMWIDR